MRAASGSWGLTLATVASAVLVAILLWSALFGPNGVTDHDALRTELAKIEAENEALRTQNAELEAESNALVHEPDHLEHVIREELGWVRPDELLIVLPPDR